MKEMSLDRRGFLVAASMAAGGFALRIVPLAEAGPLGASAGPWAGDAAPGRELSPWIEIAPDDAVTIRVPTPEIGNGAATQVAMNVAEELACDWSRVRTEFCSVQRDYLEKGVYTSGFLPFFGGHGTDKLRMKHALQLGASARERLRAAAAQRWGVAPAEVEAANSLLKHGASGRSLRYGEVAAEAAQIRLPQEPALKRPEQWSFLGKASPSKLHIPGIVTGKAVFGIDVKLPGMVHAALLQAPVHGGKLKSHRPDIVLGMPGVRAVVVLDPAKTRGSPVPSKATWGPADNRVQSAVAVIADHYWQARKALESLPVEWDSGAAAAWPTDERIYASARALLDQDGGRSLRKFGDVSAVAGAKSVEQVYSTPYCENAAMEPLNATALVTADRAEIWCPTQDMLQAFWVAVDETGIAPDKVKLHQTYVGGGFGRRTQGDDVRMAVAVAKEFPGVPVKTLWSREETFRQGRFRTPIVTRFKAALDADGMPLAVESKAVFVGTRPLFQLNFGYDDQPYFNKELLANAHFMSAQLPVHVLNGAYRGPCFNSHAFFVESFIDECAVAAGTDPLEYRLKLLAKWDKSWSDCLRLAAEKSGWGKRLPKGEGLGIAITNWPQAAMRNSGTTICAAAHVKVSRDGLLTVRRVDVAFDCGRVANADAVRAQIEGGTIFGMNAALREKITLRDGAVVEGNFHQYPMLRMGDMPAIHVHFGALSGHERMDIVGEAPVGPIGPALANAIFQATGKRLRSTPFRQEDLRWS